MTLPALIFSVLIALMIGSLFHVAVGGGPGRLLLYLVLSLVGYGAGQWIAEAQQWTILPVGPVQLGAAVLGSLILLLVGHWLGKVNITTGDRSDTV